MGESILAKCSSLLILVLVVCFVQRTSSQTEDRIVPFPRWSATYEEEDDVILEVTRIKIGNQKITLGDTFRYNENWLKEMKLSVRNVSTKTIMAFSVGGGLLEGIDKELEPYQSYRYGISWEWTAPIQSRKLFGPGETIELTYSNVDGVYKRVLGRVGEGSLHKLMFMAPSVEFKKGDGGRFPQMRFRVDAKNDD